MKKIILLLTISLILAGCSSHDDLQQWMEQVKAQVKKTYKPVDASPPVLQSYNPPVFAGLNAFDPARLTEAQKDALNRGPNAPDLNRPKEILEGIGLGKISYVGSLISRTKKLAYVQANNHVYTVRVGNYMGTDYGKITDITPNKIILQETIQNTEGKWVHRDAEIALTSK